MLSTALVRVPTAAPGADLSLSERLSDSLASSLDRLRRHLPRSVVAVGENAVGMLPSLSSVRTHIAWPPPAA